MNHELAPIDVTAVTHKYYRDIESRSCAPLQKVGALKYAMDESTEVICVAFARDSNPVQVWLPGDPIPLEAYEAARCGTGIAHNDPFESAVEQHVLARIGWPLIPLERHSCTLARCLALALPASLGAAADALKLEHRKDEAGERLMRLMSKPRKPRKGEDSSKVYWHDEPDKLQRLYEYCKQDVEVLRELDNRVPPLSEFEQTLWALNCRINERGFHIDRPFAEAARKIARAAAPEIDAELAEITGGAVTSINQVARLLKWLQSQGA
jgi:DNA polymerase